MKVAYSSKTKTSAAAQREMASKSGTHKGEEFSLVGRIVKTHSKSAGVYVSKWRGDTTIELHECERLLYDWRRSGTVIFIDITLIDELIRLLEQARQLARSLAGPK
jgi:hypothetical protein